MAYHSGTLRTRAPKSQSRPDMQYRSDSSYLTANRRHDALVSFYELTVTAIIIER